MPSLPPVLEEPQIPPPPQLSPEELKQQKERKEKVRRRGRGEWELEEWEGGIKLIEYRETKLWERGSIPIK